MIEFAFGLCLGAVLATITVVWIFARKDVDEYRAQLDAMRRATGVYDYESDGSDL